MASLEILDLGVRDCLSPEGAEAFVASALKLSTATVPTLPKVLLSHERERGMLGAALAAGDAWPWLLLIL